MAFNLKYDGMHPYDALTTDEHDYYRCSLCDASINAILVKTNGDKAAIPTMCPKHLKRHSLRRTTAVH